MPRREEICIVGLDHQGPMERDMQGGYLMLAVKIGYPGSRVSDIFIGDQMVQVSNVALFAANELHEQVYDTEGG